MEGVYADPQVEGILAGCLGDVLVGTDTGSFEGFGGKLFVFVGDHVDAKREVVHRSLLTTQIEDTNLGVGNTTVEPGLRVRL